MCLPKLLYWREHKNITLQRVEYFLASLSIFADVLEKGKRRAFLPTCRITSFGLKELPIECSPRAFFSGTWAKVWKRANFRRLERILLHWNWITRRLEMIICQLLRTMTRKNNDDAVVPWDFGWNSDQYFLSLLH